MDLSSLTGAFVGLHYVLAVRTGHEELMMGEDEAKQFMKSAQNVARHYSVETTQKTMDWVAFAMCAGGIYGTRFAAIAAKKKAGGRRGPAEVVDFPGMTGEAAYFDGSEHIEP